MLEQRYIVNFLFKEPNKHLDTFSGLYNVHGGGPMKQPYVYFSIAKVRRGRKDLPTSVWMRC
jgi:hypothetical protein